MIKNLQNRVRENIARHGMIRPGGRIGLGVSGGADSVAMLRIFADLRSQLGITILVLHFNHQLRGMDADEDERFVNVLAEKFQLEFESGRADVSAEAKYQGWNLEDAARRLRYQFFSSAAAARGLDCVAVAHTANDQAETVLSHLLRGTGLTGLAGIYPVAGPIVRPLLGVQREELREYLSNLGQTWREDASNQDTSRMRARIRHRLIPFLLQEFDGAALRRLSRLAEHARQDEAFWRSLEDERCRALTTRESSDTISLGIGELLSPLRFPTLADTSVGQGQTSTSNPTTALTHRLVRRIYAELRGSREQLTSRHVDSVLELATSSQSGAAIDLPGIRVERVFDRLRFTEVSVARDAAQRSENSHSEDFRHNGGFAYAVPRPANLEGASIIVTEIHRRFSLKMVDWRGLESDTVPGKGALDFDRVQWPLVLRNWRPGDSYRPHGSRHVRKLKRLLLESRIPRYARGRWPVLACGGKVIWAFGFPVAEELAPGPATRTGLLVDEEAL